MARGRWLVWLMGLGLAGLFTAVVTACTSRPPSATPVATPTLTPTATQPRQGAAFRLAPQQDSNLPGVEAGVTEDGAPYRGAADAAVTMVEFSDFQCPFCRRHFLETQPELDKRYLSSGLVKHVFKNFPLTQLHPQAEPAAQAALCAGVQGKFWPMHDVLFQRQEEWAGKEDPGTYFRQYAEALNLDMAAYDACWAAQPFTEHIRRDVEEGKQRGVSGTPTFFINGWRVEGAQPLEVFTEAIERAARGEEPTPTPTPSYADLHPFEPNPETPGRTYWGDAYVGSAKARVVVLEVLDLLCPYCRRHHLEVWPEFKARYVDTGQVRVVFKHLLGHQDSALAAEAAECAGNQGRFVDYVDLLYREADQWASLPREEKRRSFQEYARQVGVDPEAFAACLEGREMRDKVLTDHQTILAAGITGTPTFIVLVNNQVLGQIPGFIPLDQWEQVMARVQEWLQNKGQP